MALHSSRPRLRRGDLLPAVRTPPPGPRARALCARLAAFEAPGINTLPAGDATILWQEALGANVLDVDGNRYVDLTAGFGVAAIGHRHPRVVAAVRRQAGRLLHGLGDAAAHPLRPRLAERLADLAPVDDPLVHFAVGGADAVEIAVKTCLLATARPAILVFEPAYHGVTLGALAVSSRQAFRRPFAAHLHRRAVRLPFACDPARVEATLASRPDIGGVLLEPIVGREGVLVPPDGWLSAVASACRGAGALLVADEIFTGFGRCGRRFAVDHEGVRPDLLCCGKALAGGLPLGAVIGRREPMTSWQVEGEALHTGTFVGHPLACAAAVASLEILEGDDLASRAAALGRGLARRLRRWPVAHPSILDVRGRGLLWGVELASPEQASGWVLRARRRGVLLLSGGPEGRVVQISPPLTITERQLSTAVELLEATRP